MNSPRTEEEKTTKDIGNLFRQVKETKTIKDRILRDIENLIECKKEEGNYYKPVIFGVTIILNVRATEIEINHY